MTCYVKFTYAIPVDLATFPWVFLFAKGSHIHPPPPPTATPQELLTKVKNLLGQHDILTLTRGTYNWSQTSCKIVLLTFLQARS